MENDFQIKQTDINSYDISEDGDIVIEKSKDIFILEFDEYTIDLTKDYFIENLIVIQNDAKIELQNKDQLAYFKSLIEELKGEINGSKNIEST